MIDVINELKEASIDRGELRSQKQYIIEDLTCELAGIKPMDYLVGAFGKCNPKYKEKVLYYAFRRLFERGAEEYDEALTGAIKRGLESLGKLEQ